MDQDFFVSNINDRIDNDGQIPFVDKAWLKLKLKNDIEANQERLNESKRINFKLEGIKNELLAFQSDELKGNKVQVELEGNKRKYEERLKPLKMKFIGELQRITIGKKKIKFVPILRNLIEENLKNSSDNGGEILKRAWNENSIKSSMEKIFQVANFFYDNNQG